MASLSVSIPSVPVDNSGSGGIQKATDSRDEASGSPSRQAASARKGSLVESTNEVGHFVLSKHFDDFRAKSSRWLLGKKSDEPEKEKTPR
jgi:hypothetical protein